MYKGPNAKCCHSLILFFFNDILMSVAFIMVFCCAPFSLCDGWVNF